MGRRQRQRVRDANPFHLGDTVLNSVGQRGLVVGEARNHIDVRWENLPGETRQIPFDHPAYRGMRGLRDCAECCDWEAAEDDYLCVDCREKFQQRLFSG